MARPRGGVDLDQFAAAGYFLARLSDREPWMSAELLPERILSACSCICTFFPDSWAMNWSSSPEERSKAAAVFQVPDDRRASRTSWAEASFDKAFGWPRVLYSLEDARTARKLLGATVDGVVLFALGLPRDLAEEFLDGAQAPPQQEGYAAVGATGYFKCVASAEPLAAGGAPLGFELLSSWMGLLTHSWLCNGLEQQLHEKAGLVPNPNGFIADLHTACDCVRRIDSGEVSAEPEAWFPWLVVQYD
jgi:hypothetical protein